MVAWKRITRTYNWLDSAINHVEILVTDGKEIYSGWFEEGNLKLHPDIYDSDAIKKRLTHWVGIQGLSLPNKQVNKPDTNREFLFIDEMR